ncbi:hypothetical protein AeMF1_000188 [Aphanomyces euteiches]|nr:hypothetical protein AeMF1_000188 [Aphanomyces euteiches]
MPTSTTGTTAMWFVWDAGLVVTLMGIGCMLGSVLGCIYNVSQWIGPSLLCILLVAILISLAVMTATAHWFTMTTNPGVIPKEAHIHPFDPEAEENGLKSPRDLELVYCEPCDRKYPKRAEHCHTCNGCVVLLDHHCPWVNNCIGINNAKNFILMLLYISMTCFYMITLTVVQVLTCTSQCGFKGDTHPGRVGVWVLAISSLFFLLCAIMFIMEMYSIAEDEAYGAIAAQLSLDQESREHESKFRQRLGVLFGSDRFGWHWLIPGRDVHRRRRNAEMELILGYHDD